MPLQKIRSAYRGLSFPSWSVPIALLILVLLSYGLRILSLGFYWDDWPYLWFFDRLGPQGIIQAFAGDRPFLSFIYILCLTAFGHSTLAWQIFGLLARWLCSLGLWWALSLTWPGQKHKATWVVILFTIYPGFTQQWISVIYGQAFFLFAALFFSIGITLWLARRKTKRWGLVAGTVLALALSAFTMFSTEYFFGLELLRPALLWLVLRECADSAEKDTGNQGNLRWRNLWKRAGQVAAWWAPYLALMIIFVFWRSFIHVFAGYQMTALQGLEKSPFLAAWDLARTMLKDLVVSTIVAWGQISQLANQLESTANELRLLGLMLLTGLLTSLYLSRFFADGANHGAKIAEDSGAAAPEQTALVTSEPGGAEQKGHSAWAIQAILVGIFAMLASGWPFWITGLPLRMGFPQDRFSLPLSVGACLLLAGAVDGLGKNITRKAVILSVAVALATGFHFTTSANYRDDWGTARDFFWQLTWRAPQVEPNTVFLSTSLPFRYFEDDSLTAPLNWTYDPNGRSTQMNYILYDLNVRYHNLPPFHEGNPIEKDFRATHFSGSTYNLLFFYYAPPGCVRILDPVYDADLYNLPSSLLANMAIANPQGLIKDQTPAAAPPEEIFSQEPKHRWCYFFEKADLARQNGDWQAIVALSNESIRKGFRPEDPAEYLPFIEAYYRMGLWDDAYQLTESAYTDSPALRPALCAVYRRAAKDPITAGQERSARVSENLNKLLNCPTP